MCSIELMQDGSVSWDPCCTTCGKENASAITKLCKNCWQLEYYNKNKKEINTKLKQRYATDPEFKAKTKERAHKYLLNPEKAAKKKAQQALRYKTPIVRFQYGKSKAKMRGLPWTLTRPIYYALILMPCDYCKGYFPPCTTGCGLDRLSNDKSIGYTAANVVSCCETCNSIKMDKFNPEETRIMVQSLIQFRKLNHMNNIVNFEGKETNLPVGNYTATVLK